MGYFTPFRGNLTQKNDRPFGMGGHIVRGGSVQRTIGVHLFGCSLARCCSGWSGSSKHQHYEKQYEGKNPSNPGQVARNEDYYGYRQGYHEEEAKKSKFEG